MWQIIVGFDGSKPSLEAVRFAGRLAGDLGAQIIAEHVYQSLPRSWSPMPADPGSEQADRETAEQELHGRLAEVLGPLGLKWSFETRTGEPAEQLELLAGERDADMIVVGSRGHVVTHPLLLGSVPTRLIHHAKRPVVVARH
jgi:nucleotide-binding universal stress UspA family protein